MKLTQFFNTKQTRQTKRIPGHAQVKNSNGGYVWALDPWQTLDRFLILGTEGGTYCASGATLTRENAENLVSCLKLDGSRTVNQIVSVSQIGRSAKPDVVIFSLAIAAALGDDATRRLALSKLPLVARTGTHLFRFVGEVSNLRGWGRGLRRAVGEWYNASEVSELTYQVLKYQSREGWSHRDLLRLSHPTPASAAHGDVYKWVASGELVGENSRIEAFEALKRSDDLAEVARLIEAHRLPRETVPSRWLNEPEIWRVLLQKMPLMAMLRNLATMTRLGLLTVNSPETALVIGRLSNGEALRRARVHPMSILLALNTYRSGRGFRGQGSWVPVPRIVDALDEAFHLAFAAVEPFGKRVLLGMDVSSSMSFSFIAGSQLSAAEASTAMAMVTLAKEEYALPMAFATEFKPLPLTPKMRLSEAMRVTSGLNFGGTDCALPMLYAMENRLPIDLFVVYTDNETWAGNIHPAQALERYRQKMGINAKLAVVGMTATKFSIADPAKAEMLDVVGFDASVPQALREFALS